MTELELITQRYRRRQAALQRMVADMRWLIAQRPGSLRWTGTQRDLVEMVHLVWLQHSIIDNRGCPYTRRRLAAMAFAAVGRAVPGSLSRIVSFVSARVSPELSMVSRYEQLALEDHIINHFTTTTTL